MKNRKILSALLVFAMLITLIVPMTIISVSADANAITSQADLAAMSASGNYYLANDITISGTWDYSANQFTGTFDGNGHTINIANGATLKGGIFNQIGGGAVIKNLTVRQLGTATYNPGKEYQDGTSDSWSIGVLASSCRSNWDARETARLIQNVTVYADISTSNNTYNVGGLVGVIRCAKVVFESCAFYGSVTNSGGTNASRSAGGIVGAGSYYINGLLIKNCINFGTITTGGNAGGIFGSQNETNTVQGNGVGSISIDGNSYSYGDTMYVIDGCLNYGSVTSSATYAGGIAAKIFNDGWRGFSVNYNINYGAVTSTGSGSSVGGIVGIYNSGRSDEAPWMEVVGNVNYGACTATNGTVLPILVSSNKILDNKGNNYCDTSTANGSGTNTPTVTVISDASAAVTTLNSAREKAAVLGADGRIVAKWATDTGKAPVAITSQSELAAMSPTGNYYLANDVTISGTWSYSANQFTGIFDGRGHTIYLADGATLNGGIFNQISGGAIVKDLVIYQLGKTTYTIGQEYQDGTQSTYGIGALAGCVRSNWDYRTTTILIKNITVYADVETSDNSYNVGGLVGHVRCARAIFEGCVFHGSVTNSGSTNENRAAGGIIGGASYYLNGLLIKDCINFGTITTGGQAGGIFGGQNESTSIQDTLGLATTIADGKTYGDYGNQIYVIDGCVNYGSVTGSAATVGGIAGRVKNHSWRGFSVNYNINYGAITNFKSGGYAAGIAAELYNGYSNEDPWIEVVGNVNYGVCTASTGTKLPIIVTSNKTLDGKTNNYSDTSTANGSGTNTPTVMVISNASGASSALSALNTLRANSVVLNGGKITAKWAYDANLAPIVIHDQADLAAMSPSGNYYLANDITISGIWDYSANIFTGTFDGNKRTIYIANGTNLAGGIFNQIGGGAVIKDLTIRQLGSATYTIGQDYQDGTQTTRSVGVLAGSCRSNWADRTNAMLIKNVTVYADIEVSNNDWNIGGLVGQVQTARVIFDGCVFRGSVTNSGNPHESRGAGGIVGAANNYLNGLLIKDCVSFGTVSTGGQAGGIFGGVVASSSVDENNLGGVTIDGKTYDYGACLIIDGCVNYGSVTGRTTNAGGIAGLLKFSSWHGILLNFNINYGAVTNNKSGGYAGGIGGTISSSDSRYYLEVIGNVNYGVCTALSGTVAAITVSCSKSPTNSNNYCDSSTATGGTNAPSTTVLSNASATSSAVTALNNARANAVILSDGKIASKRAVNAGLILAGGAIHNQAELAAMSPSGNYYLANDITISGIWDYSANQFTGTFDGNGYTIYIANNATLKGGIFNQISGGAIIKNLTIRQLGKATYTIGQDYQDGAQNTYCVGVLAGSCRSDWSDRTTAMLIKNVTVYADVEVSDNTYNVGGLVGHVRCARVIFDGCSFHGSVTNSSFTNEYRGAGGIVGVASYYVNGLLFKNCINYGTIKTGGLAGGIFGGEGEEKDIQDSMGVGSATIDDKTYSYGDSQIFIFDGCINYGAVTGNATCAGGITGKLKNNGWRGYGLNHNINYGAVTNTYSGGYAGGIAGRLSSTYATEDPWIEVNSNINYGVCTATGGTTLPIIVSSEKTLDGSNGNYCDASTPNGSGTNTPSVTVITTSSGASSAVATLSTSDANALVISPIDGKIIPKWAENLAAYRFTENYQTRVNLSLEGTIVLNFGVAATYPVPNACEFVVKKSGTEIARYSVASAYDAETLYYICGVPVNAKEMTDRFTYTVSIEKDGTTVWAANYTLSIKQYADAVLSSVKYSSWHSLINAMLRYGAAAQNYFDYNTGSLAANISGGISIDTSSLPSYTISGDRSFLQQIRGSLNLEAGTDLNFYFKPKTPGANLTATVRKGGSVVSSGVVTEWVGEDGGNDHVFYAVRVKGLAADALDDWYDITVTDGSKSVTIHYSGLCWVKVMLNNPEATETEKTLAKGVGAYAQAAIALENAVFPLYLSIDRESSYEIVYGSTDSEYLISAAMSASETFADDGIQIPAVATLTSGKKPITLTVNGSITGWRIEFASNGSITVKGNSVQMVINGLQYLQNSMLSKDVEGDLLISNPTTVSDTAAAYTRSGWQLAAPAYEGGTLASHLYNDGSGLDIDTTANATRSYMMCISSTNTTQFNTYTQKLVNNGYVLDSQNSFTSSNSKTNLCRQYKKGNQLIYCYFNAETGVARIIDDRASTPETEFEYSFSSSTSTTTELVLYGLKYHPQGLDCYDEGGDPNTRNNGAFYIIKQADNSVFLIDGGGSTQATDAAIEGLWTYLHTLTGTATNGTIHISCWFMTHPHSDHYALVAGLIDRYHDKLDLQRVMFNFPSSDEWAVTMSPTEMRSSLLTYFPDVTFMKCHTGQSIRMGSMTIDVLITHEDMISGTTGLTTATKGNATTTALRFTFADGTRFMCMGDLDAEMEDTFLQMYRASDLKCEITEVIHHGYNNLNDIYEALLPSYALWPNYDPANFTDWHKEVTTAVRTCLDSCGVKSGNWFSGYTYRHYYAGKGTYKVTCTNNKTISVSSSSVVY